MNTSTSLKSNGHEQRLGSYQLTQNVKLAVAYSALAVVPFVIAQFSNLEFAGLYGALLSAVNLIAMMIFFLQFPLAGRVKQLPLFSNIDWGITKHKKLGKYLGIFFFLHPLLILLPRALVSIDDLSISLVSVVTSPHLITGLTAWVAMAVWVLMSIYKDKLNMRYETWRLLHIVGFAVIATLATLHITTVGSHGQYDHIFNAIWWVLYGLSMGLLIYNYLIKPRGIKNHPYSITSVKKLNDCDWQLSIQSEFNQELPYQAGQFVWINTSGNPYNLEQHPFSISSTTCEGHVSFIIRELGDYTSSLATLELGQTVYVDGPYGSMTVAQSSLASGITFIAGGAGIAPILGLIRQLAKQNDQRPIRLLYADRHIERIVYVDELIELESSMANFKLQLLCEHTRHSDLYLQPFIAKGVIGLPQISTSVANEFVSQWAFYICGSKPMITATNNNLHQLGVVSNQIHYEQLSF